MLRKIVKIFAYIVFSLDILYLLTLEPALALTRIGFLIAIVWACKLY